MRWFLKMVSAVLLTGVAACEARADELVFGGGRFDGNENLNLTFAGGGTLSLSTNGDQGWWSPTIFNLPGETNYAVGNIFGEQFNDFFSFHVAGLSPTVTGATLSITQYSTSTATGDPSVDVRFGSVSIPEATLIQVQNNPNPTIYNALAAGSSYGVLAVPLGTSLNTLTLNLGGSAVADVNAAILGGGSGDGFFTVGGTLGSGIETVPEPTALSMVMSTCIVGMAVYRWRRQMQPI